MSSSYTPLVPKRRRGNGWWLYGKPISYRSANMLIEQARRHARRPVGPSTSLRRAKPSGPPVVVTED